MLNPSARGRVQLLILDDWGLEPLDAGARRDLYEILEERYGRRSTILTSQIPVEETATPLIPLGTHALRGIAASAVYTVEEK
jgi:hypothetical protein